MFEGFRSLLAFLTIIPMGNKTSLRDAAKYMPLFPLVGALIGFLAGLLAWVFFQLFSPLLVGVLTLGFLLFVTGLHHTDGLLDFGDGLMYQGPPAEKIKVMHDQLTGAGGLVLGLIALLATALCISEMRSIAIRGLIASEVSAKLSMVVVAWAGKSAHKGMNTYFVEYMHGDHRKLRLLASLFLSLSVSLPLLGYLGLLTISIGLIIPLLMVLISKRNFGGVTGDVMGATNEISRMASLISLVLLL